MLLFSHRNVPGKIWKIENFPLLENDLDSHGESILDREERFWT